MLVFSYIVCFSVHLSIVGRLRCVLCIVLFKSISRVTEKETICIYLMGYLCFFFMTKKVVLGK